MPLSANWMVSHTEFRRIRVTAIACRDISANVIVTPALKPEVITCCHRYSVPVCAGALTPTEIIAASIRNRRHIAQAALAGADIATVPYKVLMDSLNHPLTTSGIERFLKDWEGVKHL